MEGNAGQASRTLSEIADSRRDHLALLKEVLEADGRKMFGVDLLVIAVVQRSLMLINGFIAMVERRNLLCAAPLLRLQLDSIMRLHACWLVDAPHEVALHLLKDTPLGKIKASNGRKMSDKYLHEKASGLYPWLSDVYRTTSGYVHLSGVHILCCIEGESGDDDGAVSFGVTLATTARKWRNAEVIEIVEAFKAATVGLLRLCDSWKATKKLASRKRESLDRPNEGSDRSD